jgi:hypothetical protein
MDFLVINAHEGSDADKIVALAQSLKLNKFGVDTLIDVKFPWVSYAVVSEEIFLEEYNPYKDEYYFLPLHN